MAPVTTTPPAPTVTPVGGKETEPVAPKWVIAHAAYADTPFPDGPKSPKLPFHNPDLDPADGRTYGW